MFIKDFEIIGFKKGFAKKSGNPYCQIHGVYLDDTIEGGKGCISGFAPKSMPIDSIFVGSKWDVYVFNDRIVEAL